MADMPLRWRGIKNMQCGIDEAGRGALAGPVCAAAVVLGQSFPAVIANRLNDSKKIKAPLREEIAESIMCHARCWAIAWADHIEIDAINILQASLLAMRRAFHMLIGQPLPMPLYAITGGRPMIASAQLMVIVDGTYAPPLPAKTVAIIKADTRYKTVQAAALLAKTARDRWMRCYDSVEPHYRYARHKGYPTAIHKQQLAQHGPSPIQRTSFRY